MGEEAVDRWVEEEVSALLRPPAALPTWKRSRENSQQGQYGNSSPAFPENIILSASHLPANNALTELLRHASARRDSLPSRYRLPIHPSNVEQIDQYKINGDTKEAAT